MLALAADSGLPALLWRELLLKTRKRETSEPRTIEHRSVLWVLEAGESREDGAGSCTRRLRM